MTGRRSSGRPARRRSVGVVTAAVAAALFADSLLYSAVVPVLPLYASRHGASDAAIGVLFASYAVALLVATPFFAALSDRYGRRGPLVLGMLGVTAATLLFAVADSYPALLAARSLQGAAAAAVWTSGVALLADRVDPARLGGVMGTAMAAMSAGLLLGPPLAGVLVEQGGFQLPFLVAAAVTGAVTLLQLVPAAGEERRRPEAGVRQLLSRRVGRTLTAVALAAGALSLLEPTLPLDLERRFGSGAAAIGLLFGAATLAHLVSAPLVGRLADRYRPAGLLIVGLVGMAVVLPGVALAPSALAVAAVLVAFAVGYSFVLVPALPELADAARQNGRVGYAALYGAFNISYAIGMTVGPLAGAAAVGRWGSLPVLLAVGVLLLAGAALLHRRRGAAPAVPASTTASAARPPAVGSHP